MDIAADFMRIGGPFTHPWAGELLTTGGEHSHRALGDDRE